MRALDLFVTIALSLFATAYDDAPRPRRRDVGTAVPRNEVETLGVVPNRDLTVISTSNTSDARSLNMNRKRAVDDPRLVRRSSMHRIPLTLFQDRFTGTVSFDGKSESRVIFNTDSKVTWVQSRDIAYLRPQYRFTGQAVQGVVTVGGVSSSKMEYRVFKNNIGYRGGLALDRSAKSWLKFIDIDPVFAFYSQGSGNEEFHLGGLDPALSRELEWHKVQEDNDSWTLKDKAHIMVNGKVEVENVVTVIDTGVQYVYGPVSQVKDVYEALGGSYSKESKHWEVPCNAPRPPMVAFSWGKKPLPIANFVEDRGTTCYGRIQADENLPPNKWLIGTPFVERKYVGFDESKGVGFVVVG